MANLLIGLSEEILFRGYFMYTLADGIGFWAAAVLVSIGFGALHYYTKPHERWEDWMAVTLLTVFITLAAAPAASPFSLACTRLSILRFFTYSPG